MTKFKVGFEFSIKQHMITFSGLGWRQIHLHGFLFTRKLPHLFIWNQVKIAITNIKEIKPYFSTMWEFEDTMDLLKCKVSLGRSL